MVLVGRRLVGKVDRIPGLLYVTTLFQHVWFIPFYPLQSYIVFEGYERGRNFRGVKIRLNLKSVLVAYLRTGLVLGGLMLTPVGFAGTLFAIQDQMPMNGVMLFVVQGILGVGCFSIYGLSHLWSRASPERSRELARLAGISSGQAGHAQDDSHTYDTRGTSSSKRRGSNAQSIPTSMVLLMLIGVCLVILLVIMLIQQAG